jgi:hypothetical protein
MSDIGQFPPGLGYAWRGDWKQRLLDLVQVRGYTSVSEFVDAHPLRGLVQLANDLGGGDVAAVQIETALVEEARSTGRLEPRARDLFCRRLAALSDGWPGPATQRTEDQEARARRALSGWPPHTMPELTREHVVSLGKALLSSTELPRGWRPTGPDDPVVVDLFEHHIRLNGK